MTPAIALTYPEEFFSWLQPAELRNRFYPGFITVSENGCHLACFTVTCHYRDFILVAVEILKDDQARESSPIHLRHIVLVRLPGQLEPESFSAFRTDHSQAAGCIGLTWFGIFKRNNLRIKGGSVINHLKKWFLRRIELPVSNIAAIRAPSDSTAQEKFFLVDIIKVPIKNIFAAIGRNLNEPRGGQVFYIYVVFIDISNLFPIG